MILPHRLAQAGSLFLASAVGIAAMTCAARAIVTVNTANAASVNTFVGPGQLGLVSIPPSDQPVFVLGGCWGDTSGVGQAAILQRGNSGISWTGINSPNLGTPTHARLATAVGTNIVSINSTGQVVIQIAQKNGLEGIGVFNGGSVGVQAFLTLMW